MGEWTRETIEERVDELKRAHEGKEFVNEIRKLNDQMEPDEREVLHAVLLQRANETGGLDVVDRRLDEGGWLKRQLRKVGESTDPERSRR